MLQRDVAEHFDLLVRGGLLIDGTGAPARPGDLGIRGGRIAAVGTVQGTAYRILDVMPKGRDETRTHSMGDWVRPHDRYGKGGMVEPNGRYHAQGCACGAHD